MSCWRLILKNGEAQTRSAVARCWTRVENAASKSLSTLARTITSCTPKLPAACRLLHLAQLVFRARIVWVDEHRDDRGLEPFRAAVRAASPEARSRRARPEYHRPGGGRTVARERGPTIFRLVPRPFMPMPGGTVGATGLEVAVVVAAIGAPSIKPAPSCGVLDLSLAPIGKPTAAREKSRMTSRLCPTRLMPSNGSIGAIGLGGPYRAATDTTEVEHGPLVRSVGLSSSELSRGST